jgi:glycolate oxidase iron-sulfur subunit
MQTTIHSKFIGTDTAKEAEEILRSCVHCGFCNATCPTYRETRDERNGPRGRIYLMKQFFETGEASELTLKHLDACLNCRNCETTCPSNVQYGKLYDIGHHLIEQQNPRPVPGKVIRWALRKLIPNQFLFGFFVRCGQITRPLLPGPIAKKVPLRQKVKPWPTTRHDRKMLLLGGCVVPTTTPNTNGSIARVLDKLDVSVKVAPKAGCCGALSYHLSEHEEALDQMRRNIDAWWPDIEAGAEKIIVNASACSLMVKNYGRYLGKDPEYAEKAMKVSAMAEDISEVLAEEDLSRLKAQSREHKPALKTAFHCPCTLQHGLGLNGKVESLLADAGVDLVPVEDGGQCCGSSGTYSILQPKLSQKILAKKVKGLTANAPQQIATANIGCQMHIQTATDTPVKHWVELLDPSLD